jgi:ATP-dependent helicase/nuclease subunit B
MAVPFLRLIAEHIVLRGKDTPENYCVVLPNRRASIYLSRHLAAVSGKTTWLPEMLSPDELLCSISGLDLLPETDLICRLYESYRHCYGKDAESFEAFGKWGLLMLRDFNEVDKYLADPVRIYDNLREIKVIENWSLGEERTSALQDEYIRFMRAMGNIYSHFTSGLLQIGKGYQGLVYRQAVMKFQIPAKWETKHFLFCGFNALSLAEEQVFRKFQSAGRAEFFWDGDPYFLDDDDQEAGHFLRKNIGIFGNVLTKEKASSFSSQDIRIISVPGAAGQARVVSQVIDGWSSEAEQLLNTAVVLANEQLLDPILKQLPADLPAVNVTMENPLKFSAAFVLVDKLMQMQVNFTRQKRKEKTIYHKDLVSLLLMPLFEEIMVHAGVKGAGLNIRMAMRKNNISFVSQRDLAVWLGNVLPSEILLAPAQKMNDQVEKIERVLEALLEKKFSSSAILESEYIYALLKILRRMAELMRTYPYYDDAKSCYQLFVQAAGVAGIPFQGEPLVGLQLMGMLETRTLDFDRLVIVGANEGILPSPGNVSSFLPNDLKRAFGLPLYDEKEAVFAYHFYRLIMRAKEIVIIYDSETDTFGKGERSRFVTQLLFEMRRSAPGVTLSESVATSPYQAAARSRIVVEKLPPLISRLRERFGGQDSTGGLSPSALITFKDCSLKFYFRYAAGIRETETLEESAEAGTFGSILHLSLENLYRQFIGQEFRYDLLSKITGRVDESVRQAVLHYFPAYNETGKAFLQEEVIRKYVTMLISHDLRYIKEANKRNQSVILHDLEKELSSVLSLPDGTVRIKGKIDRIDITAGKVRVVDYKSSVRDSDKFVFAGFEQLFSAPEFSKQLQLLVYAWLLIKNGICEPEKVEACVIPFRKGSSSPRYISAADSVPYSFTPAFFRDFESALATYASSVFSNAVPFEQTEDLEQCRYCAYQVICNVHP